MTKYSGIEQGQRHLNGPQTSGRDYRNLSRPRFDSTTLNSESVFQAWQ